MSDEERGHATSPVEACSRMCDAWQELLNTKYDTLEEQLTAAAAIQMIERGSDGLVEWIAEMGLEPTAPIIAAMMIGARFQESWHELNSDDPDVEQMKVPMLVLGSLSDKFVMGRLKTIQGKE